jgi:uncharacterized membrane protein
VLRRRRWRTVAFRARPDASGAPDPAFRLTSIAVPMRDAHSADIELPWTTMLTPLLMLMILTLPQLAGAALAGWRNRPATQAPAAWGLGLLFLFTASGHFVQTAPMVEMLPPWVPAREALVYATGVLEIVIGLAFFSARWRRAAGFVAAAVLVGFFPANIYAAFQHVPMGGHAWGPAYLLIRAPLQLIILGWAYYFVLRTPGRIR